MRRSFPLFLSMALAACAAGSANPAGSGGADPGTGGGGSSPNLTTSGSGAGTSANCHHATYTAYAAGPDGIVGTSDDVVQEIEEIDFAPGPADIAYAAHPTLVITEDPLHQPTMLEKWTYDATGVRQTITQYDAGPDGKFDTADDTIAGINAYALDGSGLLTSDRFHVDPGADGVWGNTDDTIDASIYFTHSDGRIVWALAGTFPGPNGVWGDADDVFDASYRLEYDTQGRLSAGDMNNDAGPDGKFGTADDKTVERIVFPCRGDRVVQEYYSSPGPDGMWGTADDILSARVIESGDVCSSATCTAPITPW